MANNQDLIKRFGPVIDGIYKISELQLRALRGMQTNFAEQNRDAARLSNLQQGNNGGLLGVGTILSGAGNAAAGVGSGIGSAASGAGQGIGSMLGGLGGLLGGAGAGLGSLISGAGIGMAATLLTLSFVDADKIKKNVETLLSIGKIDLNSWGGIVDGAGKGAVILGLGFLGEALVSFGIGSGINAGVDALAKWGGVSNWPETVKKNVETILSIGENSALGKIGVLYDGGAVTLALTGLGVGLASFGIGKGVAAAAEGLSRWTGTSDFGKSIYDNVDNLLKISELATKYNLKQIAGNAQGANSSGTDAAGTVMNTLSAIGSGLAIFGVGEAMTATSDAFAKFSTGNTVGENVKANVETLLSILDLPGAKDGGTVNLAASLGAVGAGLAVFGAGEGIAGGVYVLDKITSAFAGTDEGTIDTIINKVKKLLTLTTDNKPEAYSNFENSMRTVARGLGAFTGAEFAGNLNNILGSIVTFFTGEQSPIEKIKTLVNKGSDIDKVATSLYRVSGALKNFVGLRLDPNNVDIKGFVNKLLESVDYLDVLWNGGKPMDDLMNPFVPIRPGFRKLVENGTLDNLVGAISKTNYVLGVSPSPVTPVAPPTVDTSSTASKISTLKEMPGPYGAQFQNQTFVGGATNNNVSNVGGPVTNITINGATEQSLSRNQATGFEYGYFGVPL